jgi:hypothetical protein
MKKVIFLLVLFLGPVSFAQLKADIDKPLDIKSGILNKNPQGSSFFGLFDSANFSMKHNFDLSYSTFGNNYMALGVYTNSMSYSFSKALNVQLDASIINSPANSFGKDFSSQLNGIYITRALLNYKISDNSNIMVEYRMLPMGMGYNAYGFSSYGGLGSRSRFGFGNNNLWDE